MADSTLNDVVRELYELNNRNEDVSDAVGKLASSTERWAKNINEILDRDRLNEEEARKEEKDEALVQKTRGQGALSSAIVDKDYFGGLLRGSFLGTLGASIVKNFLTPLKSIGKFFVKTGPIAVAIGLTYWLFKDIGENENFKKLLQDTRDIWNEKVVPTFKKLGNFVSAIMGNNPDVVLGEIGLKWQELYTWLNETFKPIFIDGLITQLDIGFKTIGDVFESIGMMVDGDILGGFTKLATTLGTGVAKTVDNVATTVAKLFGAEFGEGETFATKLAVKMNGLTLKLLAKIDEWKESFIGLFGSIKGSITEKVDGVKLKVDNALVGIENMYDGVVDKFYKLIEWFASFPDRLSDFIISKSPDFLLTEEQEKRKRAINNAPAMDVINNAPEIDETGRIVPKGSPTAQRLQQLEAEAKSSIMSAFAPTTIDSSNRSTNNSQTNIYSGFGSSFGGTIIPE